MHQEALIEEGRGLLPFFGKISGFYLAGGTALALQLGHRISVDFDFFSPDKIAPDFLTKLETIFENKKLEILINNFGELTLLINSTKTTFLRYSFPLLFPLLDFDGIKLASAKDIAAMKAYTIGRRGSFKDYVDLYFILTEKVDQLEGIVKNAEKKYGNAFNARLFLEQLVYFEDIEDTEIRFLKKTADLNSLKKFFDAKVREIKL